MLVGKLLSWEAEHVFPCIDLLRSINKAFPTFIPLQDKLRYNYFLVNRNSKLNESTDNLDDTKVYISESTYIIQSFETIQKCRNCDLRSCDL